MRSLPTIDAKWQSGGPFVGNRKPTTRATVQMPWPDLAHTVHPKYFLRRTWNSGMGSSSDRGYPMRWWQRMNNTQVEKEIPNISTVSIDRSIDQDAASFQIEIRNQWMYVNGGAPNQSQLGQPGFFSPTRGNSAEGQARWGHTVNEWNDVLVPNAIIRIYTGFGGEGGTISSQVTAGNLCLYGVFLVDEVTVTTAGALSIRGRDMMKLLIDQQIFPPLIPDDKYPLVYQRWTYEKVFVKMAAKQVVVSAGAQPTSLGIKRTVYEDSSADRWYGSNALIHGHRATESVDGKQDTYALGVGNSGPDKPFATDWWQYSCNEQINAVHVHPWAGNYTMYVSIKEGGSWVAHPNPGSTPDGGVIPYSPPTNQTPAVNTGANIPYVASFTVPHETSRDFVLPRTYNAQSVRVSFRHLAYSGLGAWKYRAGIREFRNLATRSDSTSMGATSTVPTKAPAVEGIQQVVSGGTLMQPYCQAAGYRYDPEKIYSQGYLTVSNFDQTDAFGDARELPRTSGSLAANVTPSAVTFTKTGKGYWVLGTDGSLRAHGDAVIYGTPPIPQPGVFCWDMAVTHTGKGYWILTTNGVVHGYGDATPYTLTVPTEAANQLFAASIAAHPTAYGFWVTRNDGTIYTKGAAKYFGGAPLTGPDALKFVRQTFAGSFANISERAQCVRSTSTGNGYWILSTKGHVWAFGDAVHHGQPHVFVDHSRNVFTESYWTLLPAPDDKGYLLFHASGKVDRFGDIEMFGGPVPGGHAELRHDGNYLDYVDIVKDLLLWSGFLLFSGTWPLNQPAPVYAGLETTGVFAKEQLPDEIFDKKPVIDAITALKEVVGYITYIDQLGRFVFRSPNWWHVGNFNESGTHEPYLLDIDEKLQLTDYALSTADEPMRSSIVISSHDPYADYSGTITSTYEPPSKDKLRGLVKPAMWVNAHFVDQTEQQIMAELIGLHITFQERVGQVSIYTHPSLEIDDQIRIYERQTGETYVHYVRGINFSHDLDSGQYMSTLTTHWLSASDTGDAVGSESMPVSSLLQQRMDEGQFGSRTRDPGPYAT